ncbi:MAG: mRNA-degrading endonuclease RelE, toxin component of the RelBE toxin-antitoxin system [Candidatus Methanocomedens sp.]|nr:MAG: mRNA-degrading endonuclease RelE, toxin component of the RelBE toxin-antitoxin system [ANME-2 cluster archaeon]
MKFEVVPTEFFIDQIKNLDKISKEQIKEKIRLISANPFRFKRIHSKTVHNIFRVRLNIQSNETRRIYAVLSPNFVLVCLLNRKDNYNDLEKYLEKIQ